MRSWVYWFLGIIVIIVSFFQGGFAVQHAEASENAFLTYEHLTIYVMPQYAEPEEWETDNPAVLVGIHGTLKNESDSVLSDEIRIPVPVNELNFQFARAGRFEDEETVRDENAIVEENSGYVVWQPDVAIEPGDKYNFVVEYYFGLNQKKLNHQFNFSYELERKASIANILIFEPYGAEKFSVSAKADQETEIFGIPVHAYSFKDRQAGKIMDISISYEKEDDVTTIEAMEREGENMQSGGEDEETPLESAGGKQNDNTTENVVMISLSIVIAGLLLFFVIRSRKRTEKSEMQDSHRKKEDDIKVLREKLIRREIDEETYEKERSKYSS